MDGHGFATGPGAGGAAVVEGIDVVDVVFGVVDVTRGRLLDGVEDERAWSLLPLHPTSAAASMPHRTTTAMNRFWVLMRSLSLSCLPLPFGLLGPRSVRRGRRPCP